MSSPITVITGAAGNLGGGLAVGLARRGHRLALLDINVDAALRLAEWLEHQGHTAVGIGCDVLDPDSVAGAFGEVGRRLGPATGLVNGAAAFRRKSLQECELDEWRRVLAVILDGAFNCTRSFAAAVESASVVNAAVVNIGSTTAHQGPTGNIAYATAKAGLLSFTRAAAMDLASSGIRVNSMTPTATDPAEFAARTQELAAGTDSVTMARPPDGDRRMAAGIPLGALPLPADYVGAVAFLLGQDSAFVTGTDLRVDGGAVARYWDWHAE